MKALLPLALGGLFVALVSRSIAGQEPFDVTSPSIPGPASPIYGVTVPDGYRSWELVAPSQETGSLDELRAIVGNPTSIAAYQSGTLPFPDGTVLVKLAFKRVRSSEFPAAFVPGPPSTVQVMVKDMKRYASTGGWGFGRFINGVPVDEAQHRTCFACHQAHVQSHDFVFTRYVP